MSALRIDVLTRKLIGNRRCSCNRDWGGACWLSHRLQLRRHGSDLEVRHVRYRGTHIAPRLH